MKAMLKILVLSVLLSVINCLLLAQQQYRVVGYYTSWGQSTLPVLSVKYNSLTYINYSFAGINVNGSISGILDTGLIGNAHRSGCKVLLSIGGGGSNTSFSPMAVDTMRRKTFVSTLTSYIISHHYDGADFDWESPMTSADSVSELALMKQTHDAFQAADTNLLITMAIGSSSYTGVYRNFTALSQYVDWYNVMTYDLDQSWSGKSGYNAALYDDNIPNDYSVNQSITYLLGRSIQKSKLVLGIPFYGKLFAGSVSFDVTFTSVTTPSYTEITTMLQSGGWARYWDNKAEVPYLTNGSSVITYDDSLSVALKCQYAKTKGLAGIMIWELSQDVIGQNQSLLDVISSEMLTPVGVVERPQESHATSFALYDNYPNPFNPSTTIRFSLPTATHVSLKVYDVLGREITTLLDEFRNAGIGTIQFDASTIGLSSGVYFYRLVAGTENQTKKFVLMK